jgi:hypothetical protein
MNKKTSVKTTRLSYTVDSEKHSALSLIKTLKGYSSLQEMIDLAIEEKFGTDIIELRMKGLLR